jgi:hypothetical protein
MDKERQLSQIALQLEQLSADGDWRAVGELDRKIAISLRALSGHPLTRVERELLQELQRAHDVARARCECEWVAVQRRLSQLQALREGWTAYALGNEVDEDQT